MPAIRTDDAPRRLRAVWLGPAGATLPMQWTYVQWAVVLLCLPIGAAIAWALARLLGAGPFVSESLPLVWGAPSGIYLGVRIMKGVTYDEPLRYRTSVLRSELNRRTRQPVPSLETWELAMPKIREWDPGVHAPQPPADTITPSHVPDGIAPDGNDPADPTDSDIEPHAAELATPDQGKGHTVRVRRPQVRHVHIPRMHMPSISLPAVSLPRRRGRQPRIDPANVIDLTQPTERPTTAAPAPDRDEPGSAGAHAAFSHERRSHSRNLLPRLRRRHAVDELAHDAAADTPEEIR